ncbi:MAG TPA: AtpZ/AtpI family protein [Roseiarcus sp.]
MSERDDDEALRGKLEALRGTLARRNAERRATENATRQDSPETGAAMSMGFRAAGEFAASIIVGGAIGWQLDVWLKTKPALLIVFFLLGAAAGIWNVIRVTSPKSPPKDRNSRLSDAHAPDKDVRRSAPAAEAGGPNRAEDDED